MNPEDKNAEAPAAAAPEAPKLVVAVPAPAAAAPEVPAPKFPLGRNGRPIISRTYLGLLLALGLGLSLGGCQWLKSSTPSCSVTRDADGGVSVSCTLAHDHDAKGNVK